MFAPQVHRSSRQKLHTLIQTIFDEVILPTHKTRYVQFLLFRMCCVDPDLPAVFVDFLKAKLFNASNSVPDRQASVWLVPPGDCSACEYRGSGCLQVLFPRDPCAATVVHVSIVKMVVCKVLFPCDACANTEMPYSFAHSRRRTSRASWRGTIALTMSWWRRPWCRWRSGVSSTLLPTTTGVFVLFGFIEYKRLHTTPSPAPSLRAPSTLMTTEQEEAGRVARFSIV